MITQFTDSLGGKLADRATTLILTPAAVFWAGGLVGYAVGHSIAVDQLTRLSSVAQVGLIALLLLVIMASAAIVNRLAYPFLRMLEGYAGWPRLVRDRARRRRVRRGRQDEEAWQALATRLPSLSAEERLRYVALDERLRRVPSIAEDYLPTKLGNVLRAAELRVHEKYGLDTAVAWPRFWLLLPETAQREIAAARGSLNASVCTLLWGLLFLLWTPFHWSAAIVGIATAAAGYVGARMTATTFADLVESAFDVHRKTLYDALRQPISVKEERALGTALSMELLRGRTEQGNS